MPAAKPPASRKSSARPKAPGKPAAPGKPSAGRAASPRPPRLVPPEPPVTYVQPRLWQEDLRDFLQRYGRELFSLLLLVAGVALALTLPGAEPSRMEMLFGWTAPLVAGTLALIGAVGLLGRRAGYWSAEWIVGAELLLLSLQAGTYVLNTPGAATLPQAGENGGIMGWVLGGLLLGGFGRTLALLFLGLIGTVGILLLLRYTPLLYLVAWIAQRVPFLARRAGALLQRMRPAPAAPLPKPAPAAPTFVPPEPARFVTPEPAVSAPIAPAADAGAAAAVAPARPRAVRPSPLDDSLPPLRPATGKPARPSTASVKPITPFEEDSAQTPPARTAAARPAIPLPSMDLLDSDAGVYTGADVGHYQQLIESTLEDFNTPVSVVHVESGPTVTQFGVEPLYIERAGQKRKVRVASIVSLENDLALALAVPAVRIEAPVPGRPYVGIEVPNLKKSLVSLRGILETREFGKEGGALALPLGRNTAGAPVIMDLTRAPHMLIAGATGSGKSVCINTIIMGLLMRHGPDTLRFVMVDPKRVELTGYNGIPHLMGRVITDVEEVMPALTWLMLQMDDRYRLFRTHGVRNIDGYNALARKPRKAGSTEPALEPLPYLVLIVDELADLMMTAPEDIERQLCRLAQMARATGIHLILATQRPSVDVVTGLIKANFPTRVAFAVTSGTDSRVILDGPGAERLLGRGDMLLMRPDLAKLLRVQGCLVTDEEIMEVVSYWKEQAAADPAYALRERAPWAGLVGRDEESDDLVQQATDLLAGMTTVTISFLQRKLRLGYPKAARLMEQLEARGVVGPETASGQGRTVLLKQKPDEGTVEYDAGAAPSAHG